MSALAKVSDEKPLLSFSAQVGQAILLALNRRGVKLDTHLACHLTWPVTLGRHPEQVLNCSCQAVMRLSLFHDSDGTVRGRVCTITPLE